MKFLNKRFHFIRPGDKLILQKVTSTNVQAMQKNQIQSRKFSFLVFPVTMNELLRTVVSALSLLLLSTLLLGSITSPAISKCFQQEEIALQEAQAKKEESARQDAQQAADAKAAAVKDQVAVAAPDEEKAGEDDDEQEPADVIDTSAQPAPQSMADDQIKLHMWDGSIVGGKVSVQSIDVMTEFGMLTIPINQIVAFYPGLDSFPQKKAQLEQLVQDLGDGTYQVRENAHRALVKIGLPLKKEIDKFADGGSVERKKHLVEIRKELQELIDDAEEIEEATNIRELTQQDKVVTPYMTVVGKIQTELFEVTSKFGELKVRLEDVEYASRDVNLPKDDLRKKVEIDSDNFYQRKPKSTGIRVNKGDRIKIRAEGVMEWTNWNKSSTPEGLSSQGSWNSIKSGTLIARIGKNEDNVVKVGAKEDWVAKRSGVLYLAIAIQDSYVKNNGYRWTGEYDVKVVVSPASE